MATGPDWRCCSRPPDVMAGVVLFGLAAVASAGRRVEPRAASRRLEPRGSRDRDREVVTGAHSHGRVVRTMPIAVWERQRRVWVLGLDASGAEGAGVGADFFECAGEGFDVVVGEVLGEVLVDGVSVVAAGGFHGLAAGVGEEDED